MSFLISIYLGPNLITEIDAAKQSKISIGRSASNTVVIQNSVVSGSHAEISLIDKQLYIKDLGSTNGTFVDHVKIPQGQLVLVGQKSISLSGVVTIQVRPSEKASTASSSQASVPNLSAQIQQVLQQKGSVIIGRADSADVKIENSQVSRQHAKISSSEGRYFVEDLGSMNGTYVNGQRISSRTTISASDDIIIGRIRFSLTGAVVDISKEIAIKTIGLVKKFSNGKTGLHECNIEIPSNSLLAVMGPSGCGKSTLLKALNGESPGTSGQVYIGGQELNRYFDYLKMQIGYVPQDDIVHRELTVDQSLWYSGKLRLPHLSDEQLLAKINQVLDELNIAHIRSNLVSNISGGQRKRVSIAVEILTDPLILFLDEPTSPLDPQTIEDFLNILRKLSQKGTTVVMVTHKPEDLAYMDQVIFMAEGGHICYYGKTNEYLQFFGVDDTVKVYSMLVDDKKDRWVAKYHSKPAQLNTNTRDAKIHKSSSVNYISQYFWLTRRYLNIKMNDKANSLIMLGQSPIIAIIIVMLFNSVTQPVTFLMAIASLWLGANNAAREIVSEAPIFKRERMFNQGILTYIFSKITVLMLFSALQSILFVGILTVAFERSSVSINDPVMATIWMIFISLVATLMGLLLSATVSTAEKVMSLVPIALIPQIMLAGVLTKILSVGIEFLSYFSISRWATEGFNSIQDKIAIPKMVITNKEEVFVAPPAVGQKPIIDQEMSGDKGVDTLTNAIENIEKNYHKDYFNRFGELAGTLELDTYMLSTLSLIFFIFTFIALRKKDTIQIK
jgi:ABC-type multidrug transport system ATPase subunit